ncbi:DUF2635 domain-containing protein [Rhizosaccharibacter radicis]|uniref:DUF2635 domain-containing protein n=1 Tax=Rhizosaccharibacter radicis TaxID=2782605 RepID=A0ABT1VVZ6_9PROT|nr:DUF2635 domain-containing protein [Acetobacteraceae bacterium KSS12]
MFVKPAADRMIRWPRTMTPLRATGEHVPEDPFWLRALADKDVVRAEPEAADVPADADAPTPATETAEPSHDAEDARA